MLRCLFVVVAALIPASQLVGQTVVQVDKPMSPPTWALLEQELLRANTDACKEFFSRYFDERGYLLCVERWGGDDGPDDAIENCLYWPILHAVGAPDIVLKMYKKAWEGHLRQYTEAKTVKVPFARDGMYYKEFPCMFDWVHNSEGLTVFNFQGLSDPDNAQFRKRVFRYAGFYMNEDPGAPNYDPKLKIIRSMFNGSRGPLLRKATGLDWAGDPIEIKNRFHPGHGERSYQEMLDHFKDYNDIVGDHPQNMLSTSLVLNAYMLSHDEKYRRHILEYVDAWLQRMIDNGNIIPTNIGLDGKIGSAAGGKWYGGVYGWAFSVEVPQTGQLAHRNTHHLGLHGFMNAFLLTGDEKYLDPWRKQIDSINRKTKIVGRKVLYPSMYGEQGWYNYSASRYSHGVSEIYYLTMKPEDLKRLPVGGWFAYLKGKSPSYPESILRRDLDRVRQRVAAMRADKTTPDTRLADDPMKYNPASVQSFVELMMGGLQPNKQGLTLHCRLRYFDPIRRRAGIPAGVSALVHSMDNTQVKLTLVNTNQLKPARVRVQAGGYAEHQFVGISIDGNSSPVDSSFLDIRLSPGAGTTLVLQMKRYVNKPTLAMPWSR